MTEEDWKIQAARERRYHLRVHLFTFHNVDYEVTKHLEESECEFLIMILEC